jgi:hypothetical protein
MQKTNVSWDLICLYLIINAGTCVFCAIAEPSGVVRWTLAYHEVKSQFWGYVRNMNKMLADLSIARARGSASRTRGKEFLPPYYPIFSINSSRRAGEAAPAKAWDSVYISAGNSSPAYKAKLPYIAKRIPAVVLWCPCPSCP